MFESYYNYSFDRLEKLAAERLGWLQTTDRIGCKEYIYPLVAQGIKSYVTVTNPNFCTNMSSVRAHLIPHIFLLGSEKKRKFFRVLSECVAYAHPHTKDEDNYIRVLLGNALDFTIAFLIVTDPEYVAANEYVPKLTHAAANQIPQQPVYA